MAPTVALMIQLKRVITIWGHTANMEGDEHAGEDSMDFTPGRMLRDCLNAVEAGQYAEKPPTKAIVLLLWDDEDITIKPLFGMQA
jgi:hypothetical protein